MTALKHIFFVEDDLPFGNVLKTFLELNDFKVDWYSDGQEAIHAFKSDAYSIALIDVMLPKVDGFAIANFIREKDTRLPFVFLTAKTMKEDVLKGYKTGADDYITKPFDTEVLLYKIEAILKRNRGLEEEMEYQLGAFTFNTRLRKLCMNQDEFRISPREAELLELLVLHRNSFISKTEILNKLWGDDDYFNGRSLDVFIAKLRKRLKADSSIQIDSIPRSGYILTVKENYG